MFQNVSAICPSVAWQDRRPFFHFTASVRDPFIFVTVCCFLHIGIVPISWLIVRPNAHLVNRQQMLLMWTAVQCTVDNCACLSTGNAGLRLHAAVWITAKQTKFNSRCYNIGIPFIASDVGKEAFIVIDIGLFKEARRNGGKNGQT